ncbi:FhaA domain-containing protein [uncultured Corynebacterium sp.]|uniref:FhaA domain-containing protein n=1 Tax=uncultured Corynebacterium sp. TaxID=159447 RepID=UPI00288980F9|nr:FhaA domain-containing protein [uncultured Corynebacterium sp.]
MDLFGKFRKLDSALQRGLDNSFARVFGGEVVPTEIDEMLKQQAEDSVMVDSEGNRLAPSFFIVSISQRDYDSLKESHPTLVRDLSARLGRFIRNEGWTTNNQVTVDLRVEEDLHTGQLKADSRFKIPESYSPAEDENAGADADAAESSGSADSSSLRDEDVAPGEREWPEDPSQVREVEAQAYDADSDSFPAQTGAAGAGLGSVVRPSPGTGYGAEHSDSSHPGTSQSPAQSVDGGQDTGTEDASYSAAEQDGPAVQEDPAAPTGEDQDGAVDPEHSYPGTTVITHAANEEAPVRGGTGEPRPEAEQLTVTLTLRDGSDRRYDLVEGSNLIGRGKTVDLRIPDTGVSRQHAEITWDGYDAVLTDLQSTNGTSVNGTPIENWLLADGDVIAVGHSEIEVRFHH